MAFKPNYNQQRSERDRLKREKQEAKKREREEATARRKANPDEGEPSQVGAEPLPADEEPQTP